jgi:hypothetical protein
MLLTGQKPIQSQTEEVVAQGAQEGLGVEQARESSPSHLFLQLLEIEAVGMEQRRCRTS